MNEQNQRDSIMSMARGAFEERVDYEMDKVIQNILDPNTKATAKRKITLTIELTPDDERRTIGVSVTAKSTLAATNPVATALYVTSDGNGELVVADADRAAVIERELQPGGGGGLADAVLVELALALAQGGEVGVVEAAGGGLGLQGAQGGLGGFGLGEAGGAVGGTRPGQTRRYCAAIGQSNGSRAARPTLLR